ncbi:polysaccharide pyruvyl transferase family protein [Robiginitalea sp. IMCC44478]|uniref:polysaccharide pyruvyl transferase family protein n=1 Tax=Robiginitalea sp. IMCC44478 TaxID=3459122 RepID=UPI004042885C
MKYISLLKKYIKTLVFINFRKDIIPLFWHDCDGVQNFGDQLNPYLIEKVLNRKVKHVKEIPIYSNRKILVAIGSVISRVNKNCIVWGSGIIQKNAKIDTAKFLAVRGPRTQKRLLEIGVNPPKSIGDPAILLPVYYKPTISKNYDVGIIPHYVDHPYFKKVELPDNFLFIDITDNIEVVIDNILSCRKIVSSSLHGIIVGHAYQIPSSWVTFSNKIYGDNVKFFDYYESVNIEDANPTDLSRGNISENLKLTSLVFTCPQYDTLIKMQDELRKVILEYYYNE